MGSGEQQVRDGVHGEGRALPRDEAIVAGDAGTQVVAR